MRTLFVTALVLTLFGQGVALAQVVSSPAQVVSSAAQVVPSPAQRPQPKPPATRPAVPGTSVPTDPGFTIGPEDVLGVLVWRDPEVSGDFTVRADGMITLPLIRDVKAAGLTPNELADRIQTSLREFITDASVTVVVRQMNSRKVFITGEVARPGGYPLSSSMTVMQLIAIAGGLNEFAEANSISIIRVEAGRVRTLAFAYKNVAKGRKPEQNIVLKPGDTVVVPER
jgi:polysaccharide export outer membrane protein